MTTTDLNTHLKLIKRRRNEIADKYNDVCDTLIDKAKSFSIDININKPSFQDFSCLKKWEMGEISAKEISEIMSDWKEDAIAKKTLTRSFYNIIEHYDELAGFAKECINEITEKILQDFVTYIKMLKIFLDVWLFKKMLILNWHGLRLKLMKMVTKLLS